MLQVTRICIMCVPDGFMFVHGGCSMNIMYGLKKISRFICAMKMFCELCVRFKCVSRHCVDITWTLNGLMGDWRMFYGLYGGFLCHNDILWTFVYFKSVLWIVCWTNLCLRAPMWIDVFEGCHVGILDVLWIASWTTL